MILLLCILAAVAIFLLVLIVRAAAFKPAAQKASPPTPVQVDEEAASTHMQALIRCKTVSFSNKSLEDPAPFEAFPALLQTLYPAIHQACPPERIGERGLLFHWKGRESARPSVFMSHYDVVPANEDQWQKPPFDAVIEDGVMWGRGTLDTKGTLLGVMEAAESLIKEGFVPAQDIYLCFGGDEEVSGGGAPGIVAELTRRGIKPAFVLDEGGAVVEGVFPGVKQPAALVGIGEKGSMNVTFHLNSQGGHASAPPPHTTVGLLAQAVTRVEAQPFPFHLTAPAKALFDTLGRHSTFVYRLIFANLWCFAPVLNLICKKSGGEMNALVRTTCAFTQMKGSDAANVMPPVASVGANLRIIGGENMQTVKARLSQIIGNENINITIDSGMDPCPESKASGEAWERLGGAIAQTWPAAILSPYLMVAASDSRHYATISDAVYRFSAMPLSGQERKLIHGNDERIPLEKLYDTVRFYIRLMRAS